MLTQIAVMYLGASGRLTMKLPAIPPNPLQAVIDAAKVALFHCPSYDQYMGTRGRSEAKEVRTDDI